MSYEQRVIAQFLHKKRADPAQMHRRLEAEYGLGTYCLQSMQHRCQLFDCGSQNLNVDPRFGRPPINCLDAEIPACLEGETFFSAYSLAEALDACSVIVLNRLHNLLGMKNFISIGSHTS
jgi:hypothetical protein